MHFSRLNREHQTQATTTTETMTMTLWHWQRLGVVSGVRMHGRLLTSERVKGGMRGQRSRYFIMVTSISVLSCRVLRLLCGAGRSQRPRFKVTYHAWSGTVGRLSNTGYERGYNEDIHWYIRALEEAVLRALDTRQCGSPTSVTTRWRDWRVAWQQFVHLRFVPSKHD
jgi:hypothetical protein